MLTNKKKRTYNPVDFTIPADHKVKMKESEKIDYYLDLAGELKKLWITKVSIRLERSLRVWEKDWKNWKPEEKSRSYISQYG